MSSERGHDITLVRLGEGVEGRNGPGNLVGGEETHDTNHSEASVVDLHYQPLLLELRAHVGIEAERIVKVEGDGVDGPAEEVERRVLSGLSSAHVPPLFTNVGTPRRLNKEKG